MYKLHKTSFGENCIILQNPDGSVTSFLLYPDNTDYQAYLAWVEAGNEPLPADEEIK